MPQHEAAYAALGKVRLEHRGGRCHVAAASGDRGAELETDRFEDLLI